MDPYERYGLTRVINATGTFTPLGVSRSSLRIAAAVADALSGFFIIDELQDRASAALARVTGAEAGTVTHCAAAGITLSVAATIAGSWPELIAALPDTGGLPNRVVIPAGHVVDYGHSILQDIRLAGALPGVAGSGAGCTLADLEAALADKRTACLLLVSSRLVRDTALDLSAAVEAAHRRGVPAIIDGAAQDMRVRDLLATGADLVVLSGQKYLAGPTSGLVVGRSGLVAAVRAQEKGIGRAMKPTKEAILGVLAALEEREALDLTEWKSAQAEKVGRFVERAGKLPGLSATAIADPSGLPFPRAQITVDADATKMDGPALARALRDGSPPIWAMTHALDRCLVILELVPLTEAEIDTIVARLESIVGSAGAPPEED